MVERESSDVGRVYEGLLDVQARLKAPKSQYNSFGKYSYRSCEDILEAVKPLLAENRLVLKLEDSIETCGGSGRFYVMARATLTSIDDGSTVKTTAYAREDDTKKGMDGSQVTGASSSYARKYALNALFLIDDTKDADATNDHGRGATKKAPARPKAAPEPGPAASVPPSGGSLSEQELSDMRGLLKEVSKALGVAPSVAMGRVTDQAGVPAMGADMPRSDYRKAMLAMSELLVGSSGGQIESQ